MYCEEHELLDSRLIEQLKHDEGFEGDYYTCTGGRSTIGYGRNVVDNPFSIEEIKMLNLDERDFATMPILPIEAEELLVFDVMRLIYQVREKVNCFDKLNICRQAVLVNMAYNLGVSGMLKFKRMLKAAENEMFMMAACEMLDSKWASQVPNRAMRLADQMKSGKWEY